MKHLIVNADDFGYSYSVNKGIVEAHQNGIVTSTSVMVDAIAAPEASTLKNYPNLSVGLHFVVTDFSNTEAEFKRQLDKFMSIVGARPTHIDTHKIHTTDSEFLSILSNYSKSNSIPIRGYGFAKYINIFFGPHANGDVSSVQLKHAIDEATDEYNEIMCHVGYSDDYLKNTVHTMIHENKN